MAVPDPLLLLAKPGEIVGVELKCPRGDCDWREPHGTAEVVNEYGVRNPIPKFCPLHHLHVKVERVSVSARETEFLRVCRRSRRR